MRPAPGVVLRRQPYGELAHVRVAERVVLEDLRDVLEHDERAGVPFRAFESHGRGLWHGRARERPPQACARPQLRNALSTGPRDFPFSVRWYSSRGGRSLYSLR